MMLLIVSRCHGKLKMSTPKRLKMPKQLPETLPDIRKHRQPIPRYIACEMQQKNLKITPCGNFTSSWLNKKVFMHDFFTRGWA